jgi:hypothetical protein
MPDNSDTFQDGQFSWSGGVDSNNVTTIQSEFTPDGLGRNQLAWLINGTVRNGGLSPRFGWNDLGKVWDATALYQGAEVYEPDSGNPYLIASFGGHIYRIDPDAVQNKVDLSAAFGVSNPASLSQAWLCQGEQYMIVQAGDGVTNPIFWDSATLRRSRGIVGNVTGNVDQVNELPAARAMDYYMGRLWYARGRKYTAGDIVGGPKGSLPNGFRDSILKVSENPLAIGGDGFTVPTNAGDIRALKHTGNLDNTLGESELFIFTTKTVYRLNVPLTRSEWTNAKEPLQRVVQKVNGSVGDRCVVAINNDLFYQSLEPAIRSLAIAVRNFGSWGNRTISTNLQRIFTFTDRSLMRTASGITYNNRLWQAVLPKSSPVGTIFQGIATMDFNPLGTLQKTLDPVWEGVYQGLNILQMFNLDFGGYERAFAFVYNETDKSIHLWEFSQAQLFENGDNRIEWTIEFPAYNFGDPHEYRKLIGGHIWLDRLYGTVLFKAEYRPDFDSCWYPWTEWKECTARNSDEDFFGGKPYPATPLGDSFRSPIDLPTPYPMCSAPMGRPSNIGTQFQVRLFVKGYCRIRGLTILAEKAPRGDYANMSSCSAWKPKVI